MLKICPACCEGTLHERVDEECNLYYTICDYCKFEFVDEEQNNRNIEVHKEYLQNKKDVS